MKCKEQSTERCGDIGLYGSADDAENEDYIQEVQKQVRQVKDTWVETRVKRCQRVLCRRTPPHQTDESIDGVRQWNIELKVWMKPEV